MRLRHCINAAHSLKAQMEYMNRVQNAEIEFRVHGEVVCGWR